MTGSFLSEKFLIKHNHERKRIIILTDYFNFQWLVLSAGNVWYEVLRDDDVKQMIHDDRYVFYSCVTSEKMKRVFDKMFEVDIPLVDDPRECNYRYEDISREVSFLSPMMSSVERDDDERRIFDLIDHNAIKFAMYTLLD